MFRAVMSRYSTLTLIGRCPVLAPEISMKAHRYMGFLDNVYGACSPARNRKPFWQGGVKDEQNQYL